MASLPLQFTATVDFHELVRAAAQLFQNFHTVQDIYYLNQAIGLLGIAVDFTERNNYHAPETAFNLSIYLYERYQMTGAENDIEDAIVRATQILRTSGGNTNRPQFLYNLGLFYRSRYENNLEWSDLDQAISQTRNAVAEALENRKTEAPDYLKCLFELFLLQNKHDYSEQKLQEAINSVETLLMGQDDVVDAGLHEGLRSLFHTKYEYTSELADLQKAISHGEAAVAAISTGYPSRSLRLMNLSRHQLTLYSRSEDKELLGRALSNAREAASLHNSGEMSYEIKIHLMTVLYENYRRFKSINDLNEGIGVTTELLDGTEIRDSFWAQRAFSLSAFLRTRYRTLSEIVDLNRAIDLLREATAILSQDLYAHLTCNSNLATALRERFQRLGEMEDLVEASDISRASIEQISANYVDNDRMKQHRLLAFEEMSLICHLRHESGGDHADLEEAIEFARQVVKLETDRSERERALTALASVLSAGFHESGNMDRLDEALSWAKEAVASCTNENQRATALRNLSKIYHLRFEATNDEQDLERHLNCAVEGLTLVNANNSTLKATLLEAVGQAHDERFWRFGDLEDMHLAVKYATEASTYATATPALPKYLLGAIYAGLGESLLSRYVRLQSFTDLDEGIQALEIAADKLNGHRQLPVIFNNIGNMLRRRYKRTDWNQDSVMQAIDYFAKAIELSPINDSDQGLYLENMCHALHDKFFFTQDQADIDAAIDCINQSLAYTTPSARRRARRLHAQGNCYGGKYRLCKDPADLDKAIVGIQNAISSTPADSSECAEYYNSLGGFLKMRYASTKTSADLQSARKSIEFVLNMSNAAPLERVLAGYEASRWAVEDKEFRAAQKLLETAIGILPTISLRSVDRQDQEHILADLAGLSSYAASVALQAGDTAAHALQLQEAGRGVVAGLIIAASSDISDLETKAPQLGAEYKACRDELSVPLLSSNKEGNTFMATQISRRHELARRLDELERKIRKEIPGCDNFQRPPTPESFKILAQRGPIVSFNVTQLRSDAILVTESEIRCVALPNLNFEDLKKHARLLSMKAGLTRGSLRTKFERNNTLRQILKWIWDTAVYPVLQELGIRQSSNPCDMPRIWWTASGPMGLIPIHAAGEHATASSPCLLNFAIPSYTPILKALAHARESTWNPLRGPTCEAVLIATPNLIGHDVLTVDAEVEAIHREVGKVCATRLLTKPSKEEVLSLLKTCNVVHFGCHGESDPMSPSRSKLILGDGADGCLTVEELQGTRHRQAQVAYLSACSTAEVSAMALIDEVVHVAGAFQLLGFGQVLGTLWVAKDSEASIVARKFYAELMGNGESEDVDEVARAYHTAVTEARSRNLGDPLTWATFVHFGS